MLDTNPTLPRYGTDPILHRSQLMWKLIFISFLLLLTDVTVTFDQNTNETATRAFKFKRIASPVKDDVAASAKLTLIDGELDAGSAELSGLIDGRLPRDEDEPGSNVYFRAGSSGGRFRMDF